LPGQSSLTTKQKARLSSGFLVEAPGIEADQGRAPDTIEHERRAIGVKADPANVSDRASKCAIDRRAVTVEGDPYELSNVVETALARALVLAAQAKRWDVVMRIAEELRRRRGPGRGELPLRRRKR
jgi:hypothetical protein